MTNNKTISDARKAWIKRCEHDELERVTLRSYRNHADHNIEPAIGVRDLFFPNDILNVKNPSNISDRVLYKILNGTGFVNAEGKPKAAFNDELRKLSIGVVIRMTRVRVPLPIQDHGRSRM